MVELKPVLTEGQWERLLKAETGDDLPELDPEQTLGFLTHNLGWFTWEDAVEHGMIADKMEIGIKRVEMELLNKASIKTDPGNYFNLQSKLEEIRRHQKWHRSMVERISRLLPPMELLAKIRWERNQDASAGMEESN